MRVTDHDLEGLRRRHGIARVELFEETTSTNDRALSLASTIPLDAADSAILALIVAHRQTAGRGRRSNPWWSSEGALMFSLVVDMDAWQIPRHAWPQASLTTGLAVCTALARLETEIEFRLKWPNDVYANGKKICGILIEAPQAAANRLVIGVGVNVLNSFRQAPDDLAATATSLADEGSHSTVQLGEVLRGVVLEADRHYGWLAAACHDTAEQDLLWRAWCNACLLTNRDVTLLYEGCEVHGRCGGIDRDGALLLNSATGRQRFVAGSIVNFGDCDDCDE